MLDPARLSFRGLEIEDLFAIDVQPSQRVQVGLSADMNHEVAHLLVTQNIAWTASRGGRPLACFGIVEQFSGAQGMGWSILAQGLGTDLLKVTRFISHEIATAGLARVEILALAPNIEATLARLAFEPDPGQMVALACFSPTPQMRWAQLLGMTPAHVLRCYGAASETYLLYERITPPALGVMRLVERAL